MGNITDIILVSLLAILGGLPTLYLTFSIPVVLGYKIYRKARYHIAITD